MENEKENNQILQEGKNYKLIISSCGQTLTYSALIISIDNNFVKFSDKFGGIFNYNINSIISFSEVNQ